MSKLFKLVLFAFISTMAIQAFASLPTGEIIVNQQQEQPVNSSLNDEDDLLIIEPVTAELSSQDEAFLEANGYVPVPYSNPDAFASRGHIHRRSHVHYARVRKASEGYLSKRQASRDESRSERRARRRAARRQEQNETKQTSGTPETQWIRVGGKGTGRTFSGIASVYHDHRKACGGGNNGITVAHRSLPCGTKLKITYKGRSVVATVTDRGPFVKGRVLDLEQGTARALGMGNSLFHVTAEVVN